MQDTCCSTRDDSGIERAGVCVEIIEGGCVGSVGELGTKFRRGTMIKKAFGMDTTAGENGRAGGLKL